MCSNTEITQFTSLDTQSTCKEVLIQLTPIELSQPNKSKYLYSWISFVIDNSLLQRGTYWDVTGFYNNFKSTLDYKMDLFFELPMDPDMSSGPTYELELFTTISYPDTTDTMYKLEKIKGSDRVYIASCPTSNKSISNIKPYAVKAHITCMDIINVNKVTRYTFNINVSFFGHHK